jgi:putative SOS response-associated peptidase YedK
MLTIEEEFDAWLRAEWKEAIALQKPFPNDRLQIVMRGEREDGRAGIAPKQATLFR